MTAKNYWVMTCFCLPTKVKKRESQELGLPGRVLYHFIIIGVVLDCCESCPILVMNSVLLSYLKFSVSSYSVLQEPCENFFNVHASFKGTSPFQVNYAAGYTYVYSFEGHTVATLPGQQGDGTKLQLKAKAEVSILDKCQGVLKLKDVQVTGPDAQVFFS
jgi:hypothetical protein